MKARVSMAWVVVLVLLLGLSTTVGAQGPLPGQEAAAGPMGTDLPFFGTVNTTGTGFGVDNQGSGHLAVGLAGRTDNGFAGVVGFSANRNGVYGLSQSAGNAGVVGGNTGAGWAGSFVGSGASSQGVSISTSPGQVGLQVMGGRVGIGTTSPSLILDVVGRSRMRQGGDLSAGIWFHQSAPNTDRAFVGMADDNNVGFWGNTGAGWGMTMNTSNGYVGLGTTAPSNKLTVNLGSAAPVDSGITIVGSTSTFGDLGLRIRNTGTGGREWFIDSTNNSSGYGGGKLAFVSQPGTFPLMTLAGGDERVGIGTTSPGVRLSVNATNTSAVRAETSSSNGNGLWGIANNGPSAYGVWGQSTSGFAGTFSGNVQVTGNLSKGGGSFKIDHPLDPANKYLSHSFVESPDMMNVYNGNVTTDKNGEAWVTLPEWFDTLNRDFRYQLTVLGKEWAQARVEEEIQGNRFMIRTDKPNIKVSWQVTGIRQDKWAEANRIKVEEEKGTGERGFYLHPGLYGADETKGIEWAHHPEELKALQAARQGR